MTNWVIKNGVLQFGGGATFSEGFVMTSGVGSFPAGTAAAPAITFSSDLTQGLYYGDTNTSYWVNDNTQRLAFRAGAAEALWISEGIGFGTGNVAGSIDSYIFRTAAGVLSFQAAAGAPAAVVQGTSGGVTSLYRLVKKVTAIADAAATTVFTVTVPNANHAAAIKLRFLSSNGSTDAFESSRSAEGTVVLARTSGVTTVATALAISDAVIATVAAGATHTLAYAITAMSGAAGATQTFDIQVTIDDSGNLGSNQVVAIAEVINSNATGVTIA